MAHRLQEIVDNLDDMTLGLDDTFQFKCRGCGKCCRNRNDILLTARDVWKLARNLAMSPEGIIEKYCEKYIGDDSKIPIVRLLSVGGNQRCPFLDDRKCSVHTFKPTVCAIYPLGRAIDLRKEEIAGRNGFVPTYFVQPVECDAKKKNVSVRDYLERAGIEHPDQFHSLWNEALTLASEYTRKWLKKGLSVSSSDAIWTMLYELMYCRFDPNQDLLPQFEENLKVVKVLVNTPPPEYRAPFASRPSRIEKEDTDAKD